MIWIAVSTLIIITLARAKAKIQKELELVNQTVPSTMKAMSSSCKEKIIDTNENVAYGKCIH